MHIGKQHLMEREGTLMLMRHEAVIGGVLLPDMTNVRGTCILKQLPIRYFKV